MRHANRWTRCSTSTFAGRNSLKQDEFIAEKEGSWKVAKCKSWKKKTFAGSPPESIIIYFRHIIYQTVRQAPACHAPSFRHLKTSSGIVFFFVFFFVVYFEKNRVGKAAANALKLCRRILIEDFRKTRKCVLFSIVLAQNVATSDQLRSCSSIWPCPRPHSCFQKWIRSGFSFSSVLVSVRCRFCVLANWMKFADELLAGVRTRSKTWLKGGDVIAMMSVMEWAVVGWLGGPFNLPHWQMWPAAWLTRLQSRFRCFWPLTLAVRWAILGIQWLISW